MRILVIEDEKKVADFIKKGLEEQSYVVNTAMDGIEGEKLADKNMLSLEVLIKVLFQKSRFSGDLGGHTPDVSGQVQGVLSEKMATADWKAGVYILKITDGTTVVQQKIIKQ